MRYCAVPPPFRGSADIATPPEPTTDGDAAPWLRRAVDALVWSSVWVAAAAVTTTGASAAVLGVDAGPALLGFVGAGTLVVYVVDRLRDVDRDRHTAPERSAFVERRGRELRTIVGAAVLAVAWLGWIVELRVLQLAAVVALLGLFHRRLKRLAWAKPLYLTFAWTAVHAKVR